ncbi:MAG: hypothetical protein JXD23_00680 [Spirochaetales bacterium]|nr:hypothetical protein [Spirochaetales bacterium]
MRELIESRLPAGSALRERLFLLDALYAELDARLGAFAAASPYRCPPGCGRCSAKFEPDVLPVEAVYIVLYAAAAGSPDVAGILAGELESRPADCCPLYRSAVEAHCPIYPARPLVCRLFGFSTVTDKRGDFVYTPCGRMEPAGRGGSLGEAGLRAWKLADLGLPEAALPPYMMEYSVRLTLVEPGGEARRAPLRIALRDAAGRIGLYGNLMRTAEKW